jgi:predicted dehydrogenase
MTKAMLNVGLVGVGFMGWIHYLAYQRSKVAKLCAFASRDAKKRSGDWRGIQGNFGPPSEEIDVSEISVYETVEQLINDKSIDVIDICLPPSMHVEVAIAALEAKKHVFCEKPLALRSVDADRIIEAAQKNDRQVMVAHVLPYMGPFAYAAEVVAAGTYGKPVGGMFKRVISNPGWIADFFNPETVGGPLIDLNVHDTHFIRLLFGMPKKITAIGRMAAPFRDLPPTAKFAHVCYEFPDPNLCVASTGGVIDGPGRPFTHGFELQLEQAVLQFELAAFFDGCETMPLKVVTQSREIIRPTLAIADDVTAFEFEIEDMVESVKSGAVASKLDVRLARDAIHLAECIQRSVIERQTVSV